GVPGPLDWRKQFLERRFPHYLAAGHNPLGGGGVSFSPPEAPPKSPPDKYEAARTGYAHRERRAGLENACDTFPSPVGIALYRALNSASNEHERLLHFRDTAEALILVLLAVVVAECRGKGVKLKGLMFPNPSGKPEEFTAKKLLND